MSATAAPLTPADITDLLGDGWQDAAFIHRDNWLHEATGGRVELHKGWLRVWPSRDSDQPWRVPATALDLAYALTRAGLIPGQVSVTQPRVWNEGDPEPTDVKAVTDRRGQVWTKAVFRWYWRDPVNSGDWGAQWDSLLGSAGPLTEVVDR